MLATVMNALALRDALEQQGLPVHLMSAAAVAGVAAHYDRRLAIRHLEAGEVVLFAGGTGNPFFTTDSAACLRAIEVRAELVLKATKVDGVYSADPALHADAELMPRLSYDQVLEGRLGVMDLTAICLCRDNGMPIRVFRMSKPGALLSIAQGGSEGTLIGEE
jgi:uridylate kinase